MSNVFVMLNKLKQRVCIKFCVKLGKSATETFEIINKAIEDFFLLGLPSLLVAHFLFY